MAAAFKVTWNCLKAWFCIYGSWLYFSALFCSSIPLAGVGLILLFLIIRLGRIPPPNPEVVEEILGVDPLNVEQNDIKDTNNTEKYIMRSIAHRGAAFDAPENSISAIKLAKEKGMTAVEFDVVLTKDEVPVVFHDETVDRMTEATGRIADMTWEEVQNLDISEKHPLGHKYVGERIPKMEDVIKECLNLDLRMFIDLKGDDFRLVSVIHNTYQKHKDLYTRAVVSCFNPILIYMIRRGDPGITCSLAWRPQIYLTISYSGPDGYGLPRHTTLWQNLIARAKDITCKWGIFHLFHYMCGLSALLLHKDIINSDLLRQWKEEGVRVMPWTVNLPLEKQYFSRVLKVTYLTDTMIVNVTNQMELTAFFSDTVGFVIEDAAKPSTRKLRPLKMFITVVDETSGSFYFSRQPRQNSP